MEDRAEIIISLQLEDFEKSKKVASIKNDRNLKKIILEKLKIIKNKCSTQI